MIVKTLPTLIADRTTVNLPSLYRTYLTNEMKRQKVLKKRDLLIGESDRLDLLQEIAARTYTDATERITFANTSHLIEAELNPPKHELEAHTREFLTNSFLVRRGDVYHFSHESIREYLVSAQLLKEVTNDVPRDLMNRTLQPVIIDFLVEMNPDVDRLFDWIIRTKESPSVESGILAGNASTLLCLISKKSLSGRDLSLTKLVGANFSLADLRKTKVNRASFDYCNFVGTQFLLEDIEKAWSVKDCLFSLYYVNKRAREEVEWTNIPLLQSILTKHQISRLSLGNQVLETGDFLQNNSAATMLVLKVNDIGSLPVLREYCSETLSTKVAIYWDETEQLFETYPEARAVFGKIAETAAAQTRDLISPVDLSET